MSGPVFYLAAIVSYIWLINHENHCDLRSQRQKQRATRSKHRQKARAHKAAWLSSTCEDMSLLLLLAKLSDFRSQSIGAAVVGI